jgi:protein-S-isoprenylcysteine O-methyltransferase Ste14
MPTHVPIVAETGQCQAGGPLAWIDGSAQDWLSRATVVLVFSLLVFISITGVLQAVVDWERRPLDHTLLHVAARASNALFLALVAATAVTRLRPLRKAAGMQPRLSALVGTFLLMSLAVLPRAELPPAAVALSSVLVIVGMTASFIVLRWLGKSFSIMAEARKLVTDGPYALVRHPLYICEEIAVLGMLIQVISPVAFLIVMVHGLIQFRRMLNEEKVLKATFEDYESYAARTPRLIPLGRSG